MEIEVTDSWGQTKRKVVRVPELLELLTPLRQGQPKQCLPPLAVLNELFSSGKYDAPGATFAWKAFSLSAQEREQLKGLYAGVTDCPLEIDSLLRWKTWLRTRGQLERYREALHLEIRQAELLHSAAESSTGVPFDVVKETVEVSQRLAAIYRSSDA